MFITVTQSMFQKQFEYMGRKDQFSYEAFRALYNHLSDEEIELDVIALCCEWAEMSTDGIRQEYNMTPEDLMDECIVLYVKDDVYLVNVG